MKYNVAVIEGDGIGPEIVGSALEVLEVVAKKFNHEFNFTKVLMGGCAIDATWQTITRRNSKSLS